MCFFREEVKKRILDRTLSFHLVGDNNLVAFPAYVLLDQRPSTANELAQNERPYNSDDTLNQETCNWGKHNGHNFLLLGFIIHRVIFAKKKRIP
jgi:hypothetical protein